MVGVVVVMEMMVAVAAVMERVTRGALGCVVVAGVATLGVAVVVVAVVVEEMLLMAQWHDGLGAVWQRILLL